MAEKDYRLMLQAMIDTNNLQVQLNQFNSKQNALKINTQLDITETSKKIEELRAQFGELAKITTFTDATGQMSKYVVNYTNELGNAVTETGKLNSATGEWATTSKEAFKPQIIKSWTGEMMNAIATTIKYATSIGLIHTALQAVKDGIQYITELNKEMTNIQELGVEGAKTDEEIRNLSKDFNELAISMGVTTKSVAEGSVEWLLIRSL